MQRREQYLQELNRIRGEVNRLFESALLGAGMDGSDEIPIGSWLPAIDVVEEAASVQVFIELPGVRQQDVSCTLDEGTLEIRGERRMPLESGEKFHRMESRYGPFRRTLELPVDIDEDSLVTDFQDGVLEVRLQRLS